MTERLSIRYRPEFLNPEEICAPVAPAEGELRRLEEALGLAEEPTVAFDGEGIELAVPLERMEHDQLEACLLLLFRLIRLAGLR